MRICGASQQIYPRPSIPIHTVFAEDEQEFCHSQTQVPIYTLDQKGDGTCFGSAADTIDWDSWDVFIRSLIVSRLMVEKDACLYTRQLSYKRGFLVLKSLVSKKVICVAGIKSVTRIGLGVVLDTEEYGNVCFKFRMPGHVLAFTSVISGFVSGLYSNNLD